VPQINAFSKKYRAAAWNMPGYGKSILIGEMSFPSLAGSLLALIDDRGWKKVHLIGHSMGGMIAQEFAVAHQHRLHSLTLFATSPAFGKPGGDFQKKFVESRLAPLSAGGTMAHLAGSLVDNMMSSHAVSSGKRIAYECMAGVPPETYRAAIECIVTFERRANLPKIGVPTLAVAGELDTIAAAPIVEKMAAKIPASCYVCLPELGHLANLEDPQAFNAVLGEFLSTVAS